MDLFAEGRDVGMFRGANGAGLEFHADLTLPYRDDFHAVPMHGQFVLVELASPREAVLGRITAVAAQGRLTSEAGEEYGLRAVEEGRGIPEDLRRRYVRYRVDVRLLGVLRSERGANAGGRGANADDRHADERDADADGRLVFAPSQRRLPHVGARVAFLPDEVLRRVVGGTRGAQIGFYALGEFVYCGEDERIEQGAWMQRLRPAVPVRFAVQQMVARRTFVFARAGFGKSNLIKLLLGELYGQRPTIALRNGRSAPVGTVVFDPDGEYFWPDVRGRPGLCDVKGLRDELVVFTDREAPSEYYGSFRAQGVRLDIRQLPASLVLSVALGAEQQSQQNVHKLKALSGTGWREMVDLVQRDGNGASEEEIRELLGLKAGQDMELYAARANMTRVVRELHDPSSDMLTLLQKALRAGKLCVVDLSMMRGAAGLALSGVVLRYIFERNQREFTNAQPRPIPTIAVIEEAQSVLGGAGRGAGGSAYEEWVKEGRKYSLGAVLVTQQPGAIPGELLSQGDSWFVFHLLSQGDLRAVKAANAHFSDDLLSSLLNEPLPGNGVFWSSVSGSVEEAGNAYPIPLRVLSFEECHKVADPDGRRGAIEVYASGLRGESERSLREAGAVARTPGGAARTAGAAARTRGAAREETPRAADGAEDRVDRDAVLRRRAIEALREDKEVQRRLKRDGEITWRAVLGAIKRGIPEDAVPDPDQWSSNLVQTAMETIHGPREKAWHAEQRPKKDDPSREVLWVVLGPRKD
jgi:hypothetical protein